MFNQGVNYKLEARTYMERGTGPSQMFSAKLPGAKDVGDAAFVKCYGSDKSKWKFNTECCAYNRQSTTCKKAKPASTLVTV